MATPTASGAYNDGKCLAQMFWNRSERGERLRRLRKLKGNVMSARAAAQATRSVMANLTYCLNRPEKLVYKITEMGEEDPETYDDWYVRHTVPISDARPRLASLSL